eukprot:2256123-Pleurochrysis_carterae.AAC.2
MTSTGAERLHALRHAHDVRARVSRDDTRADVILGRRLAPQPGCASAQTAKRSGSCRARGRDRALSRRRARPSSPQSAQSALRRPPRARASARCRLPSTTPTSS